MKNERKKKVKPKTSLGSSPKMKKNMLFVLALSAISVLIYEVVMTKMLLFYYPESSYSIATILIVFLAGLGIGSFFVYKVEIKYPIRFIAISQIIVGVYAFLVFTNMKYIIYGMSSLGIFGASTSLILVPTIFLGCMLPMINKMYKDKLPLIYSIDLFAAVVGAFLAGFILIPSFGLKGTIMFAVACNFSASAICYKRLIPLFVLTPLLLLIPVTADDYLYFSHSEYGDVMIEEGYLFIDSKEQCAITYPEEATERLMAKDSLEYFEDAEVLVIGLGCGLTVEEALKYTDKIDVVEINKKVVEANKVISDVLLNENINLIIDDGLNYLRNSNKKYDVILIDVQNPAVSHSSNLYTVDAFEIIEDSLTEDGVFALWSYGETHWIGDGFMGIIYYSLKEVFDNVYYTNWVFIASNRELNLTDYQPQIEYKINTLNHNTLTKVYEGRLEDKR